MNNKSILHLQALAQALRKGKRDTVLIQAVLGSGGVARVGFMKFHGLYEDDFVREIGETTPHHHLHRLRPGVWSQEILPGVST